MDSYVASNGMFHGHLECFQKLSLGGQPKLKPGDHGTPNAHNHGLILFYHVRRSAWIEIHWNSIWLRARSHMTSHYTCGSMTTLHDVGGVLVRPLDTASWALTISWTWLLARVWRVALKMYTLTLIMSPLFYRKRDIVTHNFETKFSSVKLPPFFPYHPW